MSILVSTDNLTKKYGSNVALDRVNITLESGHIYGLLGPNGSGKTTFIKLLNGLIPPTSGTIRFEGRPIGPESKAAISYLPDQTYLDDYLRIRDFIDLFKYFYDDFDEGRAREMFSILGIDITAKFKTLSKGNREKVQLILVMSRRAKLYVLDEPIAGVDPAARDFILKVILDNYQQDASILICTHLISDIESILDHVIFINQGNIFADTPVKTITEEKHMTVDAYFRETFRVSDPIMRRYMAAYPETQETPTAPTVFESPEASTAPTVFERPEASTAPTGTETPLENNTEKEEM